RRGSPSSTASSRRRSRRASPDSSCGVPPGPKAETRGPEGISRSVCRLRGASPMIERRPRGPRPPGPRPRGRPASPRRLPRLPDLGAPPSARELAIIARDAPSPAFAASLSLLVPGLGLLYAGAARLAAAVFVAVVGAGLAAQALIVSSSAGRSLGPLSPWGQS